MWLNWLFSETHKADIKELAGLWRRLHFQTHLGCWQNLVPCDGRTEVTMTHGPLDQANNDASNPSYTLNVWLPFLLPIG